MLAIFVIALTLITILITFPSFLIRKLGSHFGLLEDNQAAEHKGSPPPSPK